MAITNSTQQAVYIVDGARTPFLKARGKPGPFSGSDLGVQAAKVLLARQSFAPTDLDSVVTGCAMPSPDEANISRVIALRLGCGKDVPAFTVQRNCASGMQALDSAMKDIAIGRHNLILAGGCDSMSQAPLLFNEKMVNWLSAWFAAKTASDKLKLVPKFRPGFLAPVISILRGLSDPIAGLNMGQTAENVAYKFGITREEMDEFSVRSHQRLHQAQQAGHMGEVVDIYDYSGQYYQHDDGLRADSSVEKLGKLKPFFDKKFGMVTAGNSSQVTDGGAFLILASKDAVKRYNLPVMGKIIDTSWAGLEPGEMGLGPVHAITPILKRQQLGLADIDYWEINEAFAAQVLGCLKAWESTDYCRDNLGLSQAMGQLDQDKLNVDGGAIAVGHPIGASGARVVLHLLHVLRRNNAKRGIASLCIGGGQGGAMLVENVSEVDE